jgi:hypothetical protein
VSIEQHMMHALGVKDSVLEHDTSPSLAIMDMCRHAVYDSMMHWSWMRIKGHQASIAHIHSNVRISIASSLLT